MRERRQITAVCLSRLFFADRDSAKRHEITNDFYQETENCKRKALCKALVCNLSIALMGTAAPCASTFLGIVPQYWGQLEYVRFLSVLWRAAVDVVGYRPSGTYHSTPDALELAQLRVFGFNTIVGQASASPCLLLAWRSGQNNKREHFSPRVCVQRLVHT